MAYDERRARANYDGRGAHFVYIAKEPAVAALLKEYLGPESVLMKLLKAEGFDPKTLKFELRKEVNYGGNSPSSD